VLRASAVCEAAGYPTSSLTCEGFLRQAAATSIGLGMPNIPLALVPGHIGTQSAAEIRRNILEVTAQQVIDNLTRAPAAAGDQAEPGPRENIASGPPYCRQSKAAPLMFVVLSVMMSGMEKTISRQSGSIDHTASEAFKKV